jgi:hypothetical protein
MKRSEKPIRLEYVDLVPDAMERTELAVKTSFRTGHLSGSAVKKTAAKRRKPRATRRP